MSGLRTDRDLRARITAFVIFMTVLGAIFGLICGVVLHAAGLLS
jgi:hypothetical protein